LATSIRDGLNNYRDDNDDNDDDILMAVKLIVL